MMTSKQSNENTAKDPAALQLEISDIDAKLKNLSCPFQWASSSESHTMEEELLLKRREEQLQMIVDKREFFPEARLVYHVTETVSYTISGDLTSAIKFMNEAEQSLADISKEESLKDVEEAVKHFCLGTKCHLLKHLGRLSEVAELLGEIRPVDDMNETELAMLMGCHSSSSVFWNKEYSMAINFAKSAIEHDRRNGKWHYLLAQSRKKMRRMKSSLLQQPDEDEISAYQDAYRLTPTVLFGVSLAQAYRESKNITMAKKIYKVIYTLQPTSCMVRLQLALGFIRLQEFAMAKECLDYVAERMPDLSMYIHYMGIYEEKCNRDFKAALSYYEKAMEEKNWAAEWQYVSCKKRVEPDWDPLPYLLGLAEKYDAPSDDIAQEINIKVGLYYLVETCDLLSACQHLSKAIEIDPNNKRLKLQYSLFQQPARPVNIYHILKEAIHCALEIDAAKYDDEKIKVLKETLELCRKNDPDSPKWKTFTRAQTSRSDRNYDRVSLRRQKTSWRDERSSSSTRGFSKNHSQRTSNSGFNSSWRDSGSSRKRDHTSWRSDGRSTQDKRNEKDSLNSSGDGRHSAFTGYFGGRDVERVE